MKKILIFTANILACFGVANAAVRDGTAVSRTAKSAPQTQNRIYSTPRSTTQRKPSTPVARTTVSRTTQRTTTSTQNPTPQRITARSATTGTGFDMAQTRTGAEYEQCKNTYFSCMDQFCTLKSDDYRRCSCSDRVYKLMDACDTLQSAGDKLTAFSDNLDIVGMTAAQAGAMVSASEGEIALTKDTSASKALLQAIMNSIRGADSHVDGKYSDLNSIKISFDTANAFGTADAGQIIGTYNGQSLYSAVYPQCRKAVMADCNDASLQRAVTAYLMAIEQDCNTVATAIETSRKEMKANIREGSAMLDLARIENRKKHNSADMTACINAVESAIVDEQVCGKNYHKCLDNGKYIDISTGAPITGVKDFYKLEQMLVFADGIEAADQKLAQNAANRAFVQNFENRVKKFATDALDTCTEQADIVWAEYLDKAMLDIYYAQKEKVQEIKQGCFDFVSSCYINNDNAITSAMAELTGDATIVLQPDALTLNAYMCADYVQSCNNMFDDNIIQAYMDTIQDTDTLTACRAVVKQCFDKYGGTNYENFYYPYSGLFKTGTAPDWFTLYDNTSGTRVIKSECAKQLQNISACSSDDMLERAFGGFDLANTNTTPNKDSPLAFETGGTTPRYGFITNDILNHRYLRPRGVATEIYNQILSILTTQCTNISGRFVEYQWINTGIYNQKAFCQIKPKDSEDSTGGTNTQAETPSLPSDYNIQPNENMCPLGYADGVDTQSWGACLCWENGGRRSNNGTSAKCVATIPQSDTSGTTTTWKDANVNPQNQVCSTTTCDTSQTPEGIE